MAEAQITAKQAVIIGGSAGSLEVVLSLLPVLNKDLPIALIIVLHRKSSYDSSLADLLSERTSWPTKEVEEKDMIWERHIYLAPGNYHVLIENDHSFSLDVSEKVNYSRPSIDISFESAAEVFGSNLTGILLSGANSDGVEGLIQIKKHGGTCVAQDPNTAEVAFMPKQAVKDAPLDFIISGDKMGEFLNKRFGNH